MILFEKIRKNRGKLNIEKLIKKQIRKPKVANYSTANSIGIVYEIKNKDYQFFINNYVNYLREEIGFKTIKTIGFFNEKEAPSFLNLGSKYQFFNKTELNWIFLPKTEKTDSFIQEEFDILIDLSNEFIVPLKYIVAASKSKFKIGRYAKELLAYYDFMINLDDKASVKDFTDQINHYLKK